MPVVYKINVLQSLKEAGFNTNKLRKEKLLGESTIQRLRHNEPVSYQQLGKICEMLKCQPGDILEYVEGEKI